MCEVHARLAGVPMVQPGPPLPWRPAPDRKAGLMTLTEEQYRAEVCREPFETYFSLLGTPISTGQWASVYKCLELSSGVHFAAKFCSKTRLGVDASREIMHEVAAMYHARGCARVVRLHQVFETPHQLILVMELGSGGDLQGVLDNDQVPYEPDVVRFIANLLEGLAFLHDRNIAHLDIKPQNLVLTGAFPDCDIKLCDLEISRVISAGQEIREMLGTPDYVSPEILRFDPVTLAADMWSVGVLAYVLLTGFTPFGGDTDAETFRNIATAELEFPDELFEDVSGDAKDFIRRCLAKEPRERLTANEALVHHWLRPPGVQVSGSTLSVVSASATSSEDLASCYANRPGHLRRSISKSREALSVRINRSNFKKNISKSRERLCDMKFVGLPMRPDQFPLCLRASTSDLPSSRPPWKGTGCGGPIPSASTTAINTFRLRDEYQCQVAAGLAASRDSVDSASATSPSPFVRHGSLRGRRKTSTPDGSSTDLRASLRRTRNTESALNRRNSCQDEVKSPTEPAKKKEPPKRTLSASEAMIHPEKASSVTYSPLHSVTEDKPEKEDVDAFSDDDDVFTRLYKDNRKEVDYKSRLMSNKYLGHIDDEKENLHSTNKSTSSGERSPTAGIKSPACPRRQTEIKPEPPSKITSRSSPVPGNSVSDTKSFGTDRIQDSGGTPNATHVESSKDSEQLSTPVPSISTGDSVSSKEPIKQDAKPATSSKEPAKQDAKSAIPHTSHSAPSTATATTAGSTTSTAARQTSPRRQLSPRRRQAPSCSLQTPKLERRNTVDNTHPSPTATPSLRRQVSLDKVEPQHRSSAAAPSAPCHRTSDAVRLAAILDEDVVWEKTQALNLPTARGRPSVQSSRGHTSPAPRKPRDGSEPTPLQRSTLQRSSLRSSLRQTRAAPRSGSGSGEESRRPPTPASDEPVRGLKKSSTEEDMRRLTSLEQSGKRSTGMHRQLRKSATEEDVRRLSRSAPDEDSRRRIRSSADWVGRGLRKSSTEEDVRRLLYTGMGREDRRPVVVSRRKAPPFLRSTSLTSDPGSEHSDPGGELYSVTAWEERGDATSGGAARATELRPVTACRLARRGRVRGGQQPPPPPPLTSPRPISTSNTSHASHTASSAAHATHATHSVPVAHAVHATHAGPAHVAHTAAVGSIVPKSHDAAPAGAVVPRSHDERPAGSVINNSVSRAVKRFQTMADESKRRDTPAAGLRSPLSSRKTAPPSPAAQSPRVARKCPSPAFRSLSPREKPSERVTRPHAQ